MLPSTRRRSDALELMDDLSNQGSELERTLIEIEWVNRLLGGYAPSMEGLRRLLPPGQSELTVLDVGTGSGDIPRKMAEWGRRVGCRVQVTGIDLAETTIAMARRSSAEHPDLRFEVQNLFELPDEASFDVVHAAATLHHFVGDQAQAALAKMYRLARLGVVINDFHRHPLAWVGIKILTVLLSKSRMVRYDGPLSVLRSFHRDEFRQMCSAEGLPRPDIAWRPMFRWRVVVGRAAGRCQRGRVSSS